MKFLKQLTVLIFCQFIGIWALIYLFTGNKNKVIKFINDIF